MMIAIPESPEPETAAPEPHASEVGAKRARLAALAAALRPSLPPDCSPVQAETLCAIFDQAVEFAACDGQPISAAVADFFHEDWGPGQGTLRKLVTPGYSFVPPKLPVLPRAAAQILQTSDETTSVAELESIAASDPTLAAHLLGAANSALFGSRSEISRLREAILRLGIPESRRRLLAAGFSALFASPHLRDLWLHSQAVAGLAREIAPLCGEHPETAFVAGLLHDLGRVAFTAFPPAMRQAERRWLDAGFPLIYAETLAYGNDHAAFGAGLLHSWRLPPPLAAAVAHHHRPECAASPLHAVLCLAEDPGEDLWANMRRRAALDKAGITPEQLQSGQAAVRNRC